MKQKILRKQMHDGLTSFYSEYGFKLNKTNGVFNRGDFNVLWGVSTKYNTCIYFRPSFSVNNGSIYKILSTLFKDQKNLTTYKVQGRDLARDFDCIDYDYLGDPIYDIDQGASYKVDVESNISEIVMDHSQYMKKVGFPFFNKLSTINGINEFINTRVLNVSTEQLKENDYQKALDRFFDKREVLSGLISAYLVKNPDIKELLKRYRLMFEGNDYILDDVEKIVQYFESENNVV